MDSSYAGGSGSGSGSYRGSHPHTHQHPHGAHSPTASAIPLITHSGSMYAARASGGATAGSRQNLAHAGGGYTSRPSLDPSHVHSHSDQGGEERGMVSVRSQERIELKKRTSNYNSEYNAQNYDENEGAGFCATILTMLSWLLVVLTLPFSLCVCFKVVQEYERAVIFRLGRLVHAGSRENYTKIDIRSTLFDIPPQEILTKDSVTVSVDAVVYYRIFNANLSVANVENVHHSTRLLAQTTLRNVLGTKALHELLSDRCRDSILMCLTDQWPFSREVISNMVQISLDESTEAWGIKVERVEVKDVRLPVQLQRAMAAEAEAAREARAKVIAAEGEQKAARALKEAADIIADSPAALQLRYLQTLNTISAEKNSTIIFPIPIDLISQFISRSQM